MGSTGHGKGPEREACWRCVRMPTAQSLAPPDRADDGLPGFNATSMATGNGKQAAVTGGRGIPGLARSWSPR
jgi:hypothetical protein